MRASRASTVLVAIAIASPAAARAQSPSPSTASSPLPASSPKPAAAPGGHLSEVKPMSEDMRIQAGSIDSVMADKRIFFLDVREPKEIEELGGYEGYVNIPMSQLEARLGELPRDRPILTA